MSVLSRTPDIGVRNEHCLLDFFACGLCTNFELQMTRFDTLSECANHPDQPGVTLTAGQQLLLVEVRACIHFARNPPQPGFGFVVTAGKAGSAFVIGQVLAASVGG